MARWKLMTSHYLKTVEGVEWELNQVSGGKQVRRRYPVPRYLDIREPSDWTNKGTGTPVERGGSFDDPGGEIIVCTPGKGQPSDIEFIGDPTPDMMPIDDEARAISASFADRWAYKPEGAEVSHSQSMIDQFQIDMAERQTEQKPVQVEGLTELVAAIQAQTQSTAALLSHLTPSVRR